jgi:hypothetical protein
MFGSYLAFFCKKSFSKSTPGGRLAHPVITASAMKLIMNCVLKSLSQSTIANYSQLQRPVE